MAKNLLPILSDTNFLGSVGSWGGGANEVSAVVSSAQSAPYGGYCMLVTMSATPQTNSWIDQGAASSVAWVPLTTGIPYTGSTWVYSPVAARMWLDMLLLTSGGSSISDNFTYFSVPAKTWTQVTETVTPTGSAAFARLSMRLDCTVPNQQFYLANVAVQQSSTAQTWLQGGTNFNTPPIWQGAWSYPPGTVIYSAASSVYCITPAGAPQDQCHQRFPQHMEPPSVRAPSRGTRRCGHEPTGQRARSTPQVCHSLSSARSHRRARR